MMRMMIVIMVLLAGCGPKSQTKTQTQAQTKTLTGHAHFGWEWSYMRVDGESRTYWVEGDRDAMIELHKRVDAVTPRINGSDDQHVYVTLRGKVSGPGQYGHLGKSRYQLKITEVVEVRLPGDGDPAEVLEKQ